MSVQGTEISSSESYHIQVNTSDLSIVITGTGNAGVFYGVQTLLALITKEGQVPEVQIRDSPRFSYRGLMVDIARNFQPKNEILKLLDVMAMYKTNKLHFHLTDNEGWRLEMPGIEELTSVRMAFPRRSDSRARPSDGEERVKSYAGKTRGKTRGNWSRAREHSPRQFFSRSLLSEPLEQATVSKGSENRI